MRAAERLLRLGAVAAGLSLSLWGIGYGLPHPFARPDEDWMVHTAMRMGTGDFDPHFYRYPSLSFYVLFALYALMYGVGRLSGIWGGTESYLVDFAVDPSRWIFLGRLLTALSGAVLIWLTGRVARNWFGVAAGVAAAWLLAVSPLFLRETHSLRPDIHMVLAVVLALVIAGRLAETGGLKTAALAGGCAGLAMGFKWIGALALLPAIMAVYLAAPRNARPYQLLLCVVGSAILVGVLSTPVIFVKPGAVMKDAVSLFLDIGQRGRAWQEPGWRFYPWVVFPWALGAVGCAAALLGVPQVLQRDRYGYVLLAATVPWLLLLLFTVTSHARYALAVLPQLAILGGGGLAWLGGRLWPARPFLGAGAATVLALVMPVWNSIGEVRLLASTDTRVEAARWIERHVAQGSRIALTGLVTAPSLWPTEVQIGRIEEPGRRFVKAWRRALETGKRPGYHLDILQDMEFWCHGVDASDANALRRHGVGWVVLDDSPLRRFERSREGLESLARTGRLVAEFSPFTDSSSGLSRWPRYDQWDAFFIPLEGYHRLRAGGPILRVYDVRGGALEGGR